MSRLTKILFFDIEVDSKSGRMIAYGMEWSNKQLKGSYPEKLKAEICEAVTLCGHNIVKHDLPNLYGKDVDKILAEKRIIDTLFLSALLFPKKPYHYLVKDYFLAGAELNNPVADVNLTKRLLKDLLEAYVSLPKMIKAIFAFLLSEKNGFSGFFDLFVKKDEERKPSMDDVIDLIEKAFGGLYCAKAALREMMQKSPVELAYALALIHVDDVDSLPPRWLQHNFPDVFKITNSLRISCDGKGDCAYCPCLLPETGLKRFFGFEAFRRFDGDAEIPLQKQVVESGLSGESLVAVFPTGGGKSLTFQLPALMKGRANSSLTVVISPLQSLMKDQVDVLSSRHGITSAVTINGLLSPLERTEAMDRVRHGGANLLYLSPESLRSRSIFNLLKDRHINRLVIDEAHCFSSWGQDFRVDYLYIGAFFKRMQQAKSRQGTIPVSCFTATAKPNVIDDICTYFKNKLNLNFSVFKTNAKRKNLSYHVFKTTGKKEKFAKIVELLGEENGPKIIYVSRVKTSEELAYGLTEAGFSAKAYNGKLDRGVKISIQDDFMKGQLEVIVATSAFGMGVDKDNVKMVIHYTISDSLENYMQESGRAGRNPDLEARCFILFDKEDLGGHFMLLNSTKLSQKEVYQIWQGLKQFKQKHFTKSALEIAKTAGWDTEIYELDTRVKVAIAALEDSGYVKREENAPRIFAQSILVKNVEAANRKINRYSDFFKDEHQQKNAIRVFSALISRFRTKDSLRVDVIGEALGLSRRSVTDILNLFKDLKILSDEKDLTAYYYTVQSKRHSEKVLKHASKVERKLFELIFTNDDIRKRNVFLRELNEKILEEKLHCTLRILKDILNYWSLIKLVQKERIDRANEIYQLKRMKPADEIRKLITERLTVAVYCLEVFKRDYLPLAEREQTFTDKALMEFSVFDLKTKTEELSRAEHPASFYEYILLYLHHIKVIELKSGILVLYNPMKIVRLVEDNKKMYTQSDYEKLERHYQSKTEQIHIVGEYARKQLNSNGEAAQYVDDYFSLPYDDFLDKYFAKRRKQIRLSVTEEKWKEIKENLSEEQLEVIEDNVNDNILIAAGPGSGKTRVLVRKVASLLLMEDIKAEQFLMLTFSRPAALEFKTRLKDLVGKIAYHIAIHTYHGFAFRLAGRLGDLDRSAKIIAEVTTAINDRTIPLERVQNKLVLVVDEFQDVSKTEYDFMMAIVRAAGKIRVIAVGDDDQNIYEFRGADIACMQSFLEQRSAKRYYLTKNYRSCKNIVDFAGLFLEKYLNGKQLKQAVSLIANKQENGCIEVHNFNARALILPLISSIKNKKLKGTTAVLTHTNAEAALITSLLNQENIPARLISRKSVFFVKDLLEIRIFTHYLKKKDDEKLGVIKSKDWAVAKSNVFDNFRASQNLDFVKRVINAYENAHAKKLVSSWLEFIRESKPEHFYHPDKDLLLVSTMHKVKGKEFDNVFILLSNFPIEKDDRKRLLYVAMTRAKQNLFIYNNTISFPVAGIENLAVYQDKTIYPEPDTLVLACNMKDVWLGFFKKERVIAAVKKLTAGEQLEQKKAKYGVFQRDGKDVVRLSSGFQDRLQKVLDRGFKLKEIYAKYIVIWYDEENGGHFRVVLPELILRR